MNQGILQDTLVILLKIQTGKRNVDTAGIIFNGIFEGGYARIKLASTRRGMFRSLLISLSTSFKAKQRITRWDWVKRASRRYVAGDNLDEAIAVVQKLNQEGFLVTIDLLGENADSEDEADMAASRILIILKTLSELNLKANVSIKLTQLGLSLDEQVCQTNLKKVLKKAKTLKNFIRIDMEDSAFTGQTINMYLWAREQGFNNVGIVIQSYLYRSKYDLENLSLEHAKIRLCKGAYDEPETVAFPLKKQVDDNFDNLTSLLLQSAKLVKLPEDDNGGVVPPIPAFATQDIDRIEKVISLARLAELPKSAYEFQMLFGIKPELQQRLKEEGYNVRIYVPFGSRWYPYFMRRLAENPSNVSFLFSSLVRKQ